jgi:hypothetical protein
MSIHKCFRTMQPRNTLLSLPPKSATCAPHTVTHPKYVWVGISIKGNVSEWSSAPSDGSGSRYACRTTSTIISTSSSLR